MTVRVFAPAKINLTLHVTGQRADGYHLLDSLVAFADAGDVVTLNTATSTGLTLSGPEAKGVPADDRNLVLQVVSRLWKGRPLQIHLEKHLPAAAGIGGGSADAAACFRGISFLMDKSDSRFDINLFTDTAMRELTKIGADVPMCVLSKPARIRGIGDQIQVLKNIPQLPVLMVNPRVAVSTPTVFAALGNKKNPPMPKTLPQVTDVEDCAKWLAGQRNDLQTPAISQEPVIGKVLAMLEKSENCLLARMSGSGATCFGIFPDSESVTAAGQRIHKDHPEWWVAAGLLGSQSEQSLPR